MDFDQLTQIIKNNTLLSKKFNGIIERKHLNSNNLPKEGFIIIYIPEVEIGHFVCYSNIHEPFFLDSFGHPPSFFNLQISAKYNKTQLQNYSSCLCGAYILFILYHSMKADLSIDEYIKKAFHPNDTNANDSLVFSWIKQHHIPKSILKCT